MAYANAWNDTDPPGTELAKNIDDQIRLLRSEIHERMNDLTQTGWTADPVVPKNLASTDLIRLIPYSSWLNDYHGVAGVGVFDGVVVGASGEGPYVATLNGVIPRNATITNIKHNISPEVGGGVTWTLKVLEVAFPVVAPISPTVIYTMSTAVDGIQTMDSGVISKLLDSDNKYYSLAFEDTAGPAGKLCQIIAAKITYTLP